MNVDLDLHPPDHSVFRHPQEVAESDTLPVPEKLRILFDWLQDEFALLAAENEGMVGGRSPHPDQVQTALDAIEQANEVWHRSPWTSR